MAVSTWGPDRFEPFPFEGFARIVGATNHWVIARKTPATIARMRARYGADVVLLTHKQYENAERLARLELTQGYD
jgi:hypothetical protein